MFFLSTGNSFIEIQLDRNPTTLIVGENGAGKSTVLDALCFGLFENHSKKQLLNSINDSNCVVEVDFKIGSKSFKVIRGIKPNIFEIYINGKMYNQDANARDYQKYLEQQILKLNYRSFTQVVILGSSTFVPFMQLRARHRREVVEEILDIQIFSLMNMLLKQQLKTITENQRDNDYQHDLTKEKIELQKKYIDDIEKNKDKLIKEKNITLNGNEEEIHQRQKNIDVLEKENSELVGNIKYSEDITKKVKKLRDIDATLKEKRSATKKYVDFFEKNDDCPVCEQHIEETFRNTMLTTKKNEYDKFDKGIQELSEELKKQQELFNSVQTYITVIRNNDAEIGKIKYSIEQLQNLIPIYLMKFKELSSGELSKDDIVKLEKLKKSLEYLTNQKMSLIEEQTYADAVELCYMILVLKLKLLNSIYQL